MFVVNILLSYIRTLINLTNKGMIEVLHELGIDLDKDTEIDRQKWTPLMSAAHDGDLKMVWIRSCYQLEEYIFSKCYLQ